jgi:hypothetical protein
MRSWLVLLMIAACDKLPSPPDPAEYAKMSAKQRCKATAPRAMRCVDELLVAQARSLAIGGGMDELAGEMEKKLDDNPTVSEDEAWKMHKVMCAGEKGTAYPDAVVRCWQTESCKAFAACVMKQ